MNLGSSLPVQYLGLCALTAVVPCSIPGWGIKIPQATRRSKKKKKKKDLEKFLFLQILIMTSLCFLIFHSTEKIWKKTAFLEMVFPLFSGIGMMALARVGFQLHTAYQLLGVGIGGTSELYVCYLAWGRRSLGSINPNTGRVLLADVLFWASSMVDKAYHFKGKAILPLPWQIFKTTLVQEMYKKEF